LDPSPSAEKGTSLARLRALAAARAFTARFGALAPAEYVRARRLAQEFAAYLESWRGALALDGDPAGAWLFRTALVHRGLVSLPGGRAAVCRLLVSKFQTLGGEVFRSPVTAVGAGREPFVETDGRRLHAHAVIINSRRPLGVPAPHESGVRMTTAAYTVPVTCVPEAMGPYLLVEDGADLWSLAGRRNEAAGGLAQDLLIASYRETANGRDAGRLRERLEALLPFAAGHLAFSGSVRDDEVPDSMDPKLCESLSWRSRGNGWRQVARSSVWWIPDEGTAWLGDAQEYRTALTIDSVVRAA
jgi:hypothetical protein